MANDPRIDHLRAGTLSMLVEAQTIKELLDEGVRPGEVCRLLGWRRQKLDERIAVLELPASVRRMVASGKLDADHVHQVLRFSNIFLRFLENRDEGIESSDFLKFWVAYYQELYAHRYQQAPIADMKPAVDRIYESAVGIMTRKFGSTREMFLELDTLKEGWAGFVARVRRVLFRLTKGLRPSSGA